MSYEMTMEDILEMPEMADVKAELLDPRYGTRRHGSRATAALHCNGPLCKKAERDRQRKRNEIKAWRAGRKYRPRDRIWDRDELLDAITRWHVIQFATRVAEARHAG